MTIENISDEVILTYDESYYEELASTEEIYLEEIEEELRSKLISYTPQDGCHTRIVSRGAVKSLTGMRTATDVAGRMAAFSDGVIAIIIIVMVLVS
jgi:hypothetical protein